MAEGASVAELVAPELADICGLVAGRSAAVMLLSAEGEGRPRLVPTAAHASSPDASPLDAGLVEGFVGEVLRTAKPLLIADLHRSGWASLAHGCEHAGRSVICVPLILRERIIGTLHVVGPLGDGTFGDEDLKRLRMLAALLVRSVQVAQLQRILDVRFAQIALAESGKRHAGIMEKAMPPDKAAHVIAKSLFQQMTRAGFTDKQIIRTASDILEELNQSLRKSHPQRSE